MHHDRILPGAFNSLLTTMLSCLGLAEIVPENVAFLPLVQHAAMRGKANPFVLVLVIPSYTKETRPLNAPARLSRDMPQRTPLGLQTDPDEIPSLQLRTCTSTHGSVIA